MNNHLVQQPGIVELAHKIAAADKPDVSALCSRTHPLVDRPNIASHKPDVCAGDRVQVAGGEDPDGLLVGLRRL